MDTSPDAQRLQGKVKKKKKQVLVRENLILERVVLANSANYMTINLS